MSFRKGGFPERLAPKVKDVFVQSIQVNLLTVTRLTRALWCHKFIFPGNKAMKPKEWQKSTRWHFLRGKKFFEISWSKTACLEKDFVLGVDPESTSKEHPPKRKNEKDSAGNERVAGKGCFPSCWSSRMYFSQATVPFDSVFDRAIKLRDCTLVGFTQKASQTGEHTFKMIVNGVSSRDIDVWKITAALQVTMHPSTAR